MCKKCKTGEVSEYKVKKRNYICNACHAIEQKQQKAKMRRIVYENYGEQCPYCGSTSNLQIDHINGDGKKERNKGRWRASSSDTHRLIIHLGFPLTYQTICRQCNMAKQQMNDDEFRQWITKVFYHINPETVK